MEICQTAGAVLQDKLIKLQNITFNKHSKWNIPLLSIYDIIVLVNEAIEETIMSKKLTRPEMLQNLFEENGISSDSVELDDALIRDVQKYADGV